MLSYSNETLQQDFSHAQSLTTDGYRAQLIAQQQARAAGGGDDQRVLGGEQRGAVVPEPALRRRC